MGALQPWHIIVVLVVAVIIFGSKKLPDAARGLGRSMRIFKSEINEMKNDGQSEAPTPQQIAAKSESADSVTVDPLAKPTPTDPGRQSA
ncbi:Sec-independent protein translocase subunit TatA [Tsukamurella sp. 8F]|uniref:Sec-independent protein translocase subunit TatA n=1 Tax=unclassified Tsukamurella TaxID=2633480 RepID=UPI0023B94B21|nr:MULTISPECIES: Sec-independent protein translocase subunit TatA [unclassified Tsukamurella]MDF0530549.1 Sec-independent protein translocase subunit TatA [Tsukamurella sp. 8J]MDF0586801.1 Sec-independent protein translocase subunit TatA [Tsukamurella sp. 8F]